MLCQKEMKWRQGVAARCSATTDKATHTMPAAFMHVQARTPCLAFSVHAGSSWQQHGWKQVLRIVPQRLNHDRAVQSTRLEHGTIPPRLPPTGFCSNAEAAGSALTDLQCQALEPAPTSEPAQACKVRTRQHAEDAAFGAVRSRSCTDTPNGITICFLISTCLHHNPWHVYRALVMVGSVVQNCGQASMWTLWTLVYLKHYWLE
ncbi:uncharacterized protein TRIREDRAFT_103683 [Trichoderma reesei QM6a]|uniref:Predicted protein n=2 Tax=Hypocrea jecorina TaxID=51453 RepID=G0RB32_HYPJQ|nr:uncharacterized protein TRIREDRAFT_103683 [Trichoderma reesei QM6a]EGR51705.1 predicted protein [Trichoderma reesei QM6a]ETS05435.1 hypothetical protein M419DRAFT_71008 [Trichoderma reesei RUT C-30]